MVFGHPEKRFHEQKEEAGCYHALSFYRMRPFQKTIPSQGGKDHHGRVNKQRVAPTVHDRRFTVNHIKQGENPRKKNGKMDPEREFFEQFFGR